MGDDEDEVQVTQEEGDHEDTPMKQDDEAKETEEEQPGPSGGDTTAAQPSEDASVAISQFDEITARLISEAANTAASAAVGAVEEKSEEKTEEEADVERDDDDDVGDKKPSASDTKDATRSDDPMEVDRADETQHAGSEPATEGAEATAPAPLAATTTQGLPSIFDTSRAALSAAAAAPTTVANASSRTTTTAEAVARAHNAVTDTLVADMERQYVEVRKQRDDLQRDLLRAQEELTQLSNQKISDVVSERDALAWQAELESAKEEVKALLRQKSSVDESFSRSQIETDMLKAEISRLAETNAQMKKVVADKEAMASTKEAQVVPLMLHKKRLEAEVEALEAHSNWLEQELRSKSEEYQRLLQESRDRSLELQMKLERAIREKSALEASNEAAKNVEQKLEEKVKKLSTDLVNVKQELVDLQESSQSAIQDERNLVRRQKDHLQLWEQRCKDLEREKESLQKAANRAVEETQQELDQQRKELEAHYATQLEANTAKLQEELRLAQLRIGPQMAALPHSAQKSLPGGGGGGDDENQDDDEPLNMTDLYARLAETQQALRREQNEKNQWKNQFQKIHKDILARTPKMIRQREERDMAVSQLKDYRTRLDSALGERDDAQAEAAEARQEMLQAKRLLDEKKTEVELLANQVQTLLASSVTAQATPNDVPNSVKQMQNQNQRLLVEHQRMTQKISDLESQLQSDSLKTQLESARTDIATLTRERKNQEVYVEHIVQQRDLYRALLAKHDSGMLGTDGEERTALEISKQQAERAKKLEQLNKELETNLANAREDAERAKRDKEGMAERVARFDTVCNDLTQSVSKLERDLLAARSDVARSQTEGQYYKDKCEGLESSLERARSEINHSIKQKEELQRINTDLQQALSKANAENENVRGERRKAEARMRHAETQLAAAKAAQKRMEEELNLLQSENNRQGAIMDSIRRIEATVSAQGDSERETLRIEVEKLTNRLATEESKHTAEVQNLQSKILGYESRLEELTAENKKSRLAKKELEKTLASVRAGSSVERGVASKETEEGAGEMVDTDSELQAKIDELSAKLESSQSDLVELKEQCETYKKIARESEAALVDMRKTSDDYKASQEKENSNHTSQLEVLKSKDELIEKLKEEVSDLHREREKAVGDLQQKLESMKEQIQQKEKDSDSSTAAVAALKLDIDNLRNELSTAQSNYERELDMHSKARADLRVVREKMAEYETERSEMQAKLETVQKQSEEQLEGLEQEKNALSEQLQVIQQRLEKTQKQNENLFSQIDSLEKTLEKDRNRKAATASDDQAEPKSTPESQADLEKTVAEQREIIHFLRSENELTRTELDTVKRTADREKAAVAVARRNLEEARAELASMKSSNTGQGDEDGSSINDLRAKLQESSEQVNILTDSNKFLRDELNKWTEKAATLEKEMESTREEYKPLQRATRDLEAKVTLLETEKASLKREVESWKERVQHVVKKFNQVDPEEVSTLKKQVQTLQAEKESFSAWKKTTEEENSRIRNIAKNLNKQHRDQKALIDSQKKDIDKLTAEKATLQGESSLGSAAVKERDELKTKLEKVEKVLESCKKELEGANERNERLRDRLRQFQTTIKDLRAKEKVLTEQLAEAEVRASAPAQTEASASLVADVPQDEPLPQVPAEGFTFKPSQPAGTKPPLEASQAGGDATAKDGDVAQGKVEQNESKPADDGEEEGELKEEQDPASVKRTTEEQAPLLKRRPSGETKELSMKEKLLRKKRQLAEAMRAKLPELASGSKEEKAGKRQKVESAPQAAQGSVSEEQASLGDAKTDETAAGEKKSGSQESSSKVNVQANEQKTDEKAGTALPSKKAVPSMFGGPVNPFAAPTERKQEAPTTFGQSTSLVDRSSKASEGSFLEMKPPGSSGVAPVFDFGFSGSMKLPTPSQPPPAPTPFGAFNSSFSSFASTPAPKLEAMPLFGEPQAKKPEPSGVSGEGQVAEEDGEVEEEEREVEEGTVDV